MERADKIAVIERGRVAEVGTHRELLTVKGLYYRLYTHYMDRLPIGEAEAADLEVLATQEAGGG